MAKSGLEKGDLSRVWTMADADRDGKLSRHEFAVAVHLASCVAGKKKLPLPSALPECLSLTKGTAAKSNAATGGPTGEESPGNDRSRVKAKGRSTRDTVAVPPGEPASSGEKKSKKRNNRSDSGSTATATSRDTASPAGGGDATEAAVEPPIEETRPRDIENDNGQEGAASSLTTVTSVQKDISGEPGNPGQVDLMGGTKVVSDDGHVASEESGTTKKIKKKRTAKPANSVVQQEQVPDDSYAMTTAELGQYDVVFMQVGTNGIHPQIGGGEIVVIGTANVWLTCRGDHGGMEVRLPSGRTRFSCS